MPTVKTDPVLEAIARKLSGINTVPAEYQGRMIKAAARAGRDALHKGQADCEHIVLFEDINYDGGALRTVKEGLSGYADEIVYFDYCPKCGQKLPERKGK